MVFAFIQVSTNRVQEAVNIHVRRNNLKPCRFDPSVETAIWSELGIDLSQTQSEHNIRKTKSTKT